MHNRYKKLTFLLIAILLLLSVFALPALGHHILGIPHYAYDEAYPQTPILTYITNLGEYEIKMTGYPGKPSPGEQCAVNVYIQKLDTGKPFDGTVTLTVFQKNLLQQDDVIYGPIDAQLDAAVYKFYPRFEKEANYIIRIYYLDSETPYTVDLPMAVGTPGSPLKVLIAGLMGVIVFLIVIRAIRIKMKRRSDDVESSNVEVT